jgi:hypothetical protein
LEFEKNGYTFRVEKLNAIAQFHLSRKIAPLLPSFAPLLVEYLDLRRLGQEAIVEALLGHRLLDIAQMAQPFADAIAGMKDADAEHIMRMTLDSVKVRTAAGKDEVWMPLLVAGSNLASVMELNDFGKLLPVIIKVIGYNLGNFMDGLLSRREEASGESSGVASRAVRTG